VSALRALPWLLLLALVAGLLAPLFDRGLAPIGTLVVQLALAGLLILYVLSAARFWDAGRRKTGVLLLALPAVAYALAAGRIGDLSEAGMALLALFAACALGAAIACAVMAWCLRRGTARPAPARAPSAAVALVGLVVVSALAASWASPSYLGQNMVTVTKELLPGGPPAMPSWTPPTQASPTVRATTYRTTATTRAVGTDPTVVPWETDDRDPGDPGIAYISTLLPTVAATSTGGSGGRSFAYTLRGTRGAIPLTLDGNVAASLASKRPPFDGDYGPYYRGFVDEPVQRSAIAGLANEIRGATGSSDDQARIAVALVQAIPYDYATSRSGTVRTRYPYEVLYQDTGVCGEKSLLLAGLLKELGFGVALLSFGPEKHMAVGVRAPAQSGYRGTGYAFVETTQPTIITDAEETYVGAGRLTSTPEVILIAEGKAIGSLAGEAADLAEFRSIQAMGSVVDPYHYDRWQALVQKYGLIVGS